MLQSGCTETATGNTSNSSLAIDQMVISMLANVPREVTQVSPNASGAMLEALAPMLSPGNLTTTMREFAVLMNNTQLQSVCVAAPLAHAQRVS